MNIETIRTEGLGDSTYVLTHEGVGVIIDPQRDIDRFERVIDQTNAEPRFVLETHLHNDYLSGGRDLASKTGAELVMPSGAAPAFRHRPAYHREDLSAGPLTIHPLHTPGHTPEHTSYVIVVEGTEMAVFSGGSLLVGSVGRTDLLGIDRADTLARLQYGSVNRLARLNPRAGLYPTHGAGSFCTASGTGDLTSTIGDEARTNPALAHDHEDSFVEDQLSGLVPYPAYYRHMGPANLMGAPPIPQGRIPLLSADHLQAMADDVALVDIRPQPIFASGHIPGSIGVELRDDFGVWVGWVIPFDSPIAVIADPGQDVGEARVQLHRIGFDDIRGILEGVDDFPGPLGSYSTASIEEFAGAVSNGTQVVDVRAPNEWESGTMPESTLRYAADIAMGHTGGIDPNRPVWVACGSGYRATIAASFLEMQGYDPVVLTDAGVTDVLSRMSNRRGGT